MTNMKLPPPVVTGVIIPGDLRKPTELENYRKKQEIHRQAQEEVHDLSRTYAKKDKHKTPTSIKALGGMTIAAAVIYGISLLTSKGKGKGKPKIKPPVAPTSP